MQRKIYPCNKRNASNSFAGEFSTATNLTIPKLKLPSKFVRTEISTADIAPIVSALSNRIDISDILKNTHCAEDVLEQTTYRWMSAYISPQIDKLINANIVFDQYKHDLFCDEYAEDILENSWIIKFNLNAVYYEFFDIKSQIQAYEKANKGLGQYLLSLINQTPYNIATPSYMQYFVSSIFWGYMDDEVEYALEMCGDDEEEQKNFLEYIPLTKDDLNSAFPAWALKPQDSYKDEIPPEIAAIAKLPIRKFEHISHHLATNFPGIIIWNDVDDFCDKALRAIEEQQMNDGENITLCETHWVLPPNDKQIWQNIFEEIELFIGGFYNILQLIYNIKEMKIC